MTAVAWSAVQWPSPTVATSLSACARVLDHVSYVPGAHLLELIMQPNVWSAEARQMKPCRPPSTVRKMAVAEAKAVIASTEVWLVEPRVPGRWNNRHNWKVFIARLRWLTAYVRAVRIVWMARVALASVNRVCHRAW